MTFYLPSIHGRNKPFPYAGHAPDMGFVDGDHYESGDNPVPPMSEAERRRQQYLYDSYENRMDKRREELNEAGVSGDKTMVRSQICGSCSTINDADSEVCKSCGADPRAGHPRADY